MSFRKADNQDRAAIQAAMLHWYTKSHAYQMPDTDWAEVMCHVAARIHDGKGYFSHGYFIMVDIGKPWFANKLYLIEEIILKVYDTYEPVRLAIADLDKIAKEHGCTRVVTGDTQTGYMDRWYKEAGFAHMGNQFYKELPDGIHPETDRGASPD